MIWFIYGAVMAVASSARFIPQVIKAFRSKQVNDLSEAMIWWTIITGSAWMVYNIKAIMEAGMINWPYLFNNAVQVASMLVLAGLFYRHRGSECRHDWRPDGWDFDLRRSTMEWCRKCGKVKRSGQ